ncbi:MAG: hypothetical protein ACE5HD_01850 [Acidobacteriota bacterium]
MEPDYRFVLEMFDGRGVRVGQAPLEVDWEPALECARFVAVRKGELPVEMARPESSLEPIWHRTLGKPFMSGFRVSFHTRKAPPVAREFTTRYFRRQALEASSGLPEADPDGEQRRGYLVTAYARSHPRAGTRRGKIRLRQTGPFLPFRKGDLRALEERSSALHGTAGKSFPANRLPEGADDPPVFLPERVLREVTCLGRAAGARETGGVLIGYLHHDPCLPEIFARVTAQVPAQGARAEVDRLTFTADTWTAVRRAMDRRGKEEILLGWWHTHPVSKWCEACPLDRRRRCPLAVDFFSGHDRLLHRTIFPQAYGVALVVNGIAAGHETYSVFGWREGLLEPRDCFVLDSSEGEPRHPRAPLTEE